MSLHHDIPSEFTDDGRWFHFFTKKGIIFVAVGLVIMYGLYKVTVPFGFTLAGVIVGLVITILLGFVSMFPSPSDYIHGSGITIDVLILRRFIRWANRCIYVKGYEAGIDKSAPAKRFAFLGRTT